MTALKWVFIIHTYMRICFFSFEIFFVSLQKKRSGYEGDGEVSGAGAPAGKRRGGKKNKGEGSSGNVHARVQVLWL